MDAMCRNCGHVNARVRKAKPPHFARLICPKCGKWIKWIAWSVNVDFDEEPDKPVQQSLFDVPPSGGASTKPRSRPGEAP